jgi:hypothetical protein
MCSNPSFFYRLPNASTDPISGLSSTSWLLSQPADFRKLHIPMPYEQIPSLMQQHPVFPTPAQFGEPLEVGGWKNSKPSWVQVMPRSRSKVYNKRT